MTKEEARAHYDAVHKEAGRIWADANYQAGRIRDREIAAARARGTYESTEMLKIEYRFDQRMYKFERQIHALTAPAHFALLRACGLFPEEKSGEMKEHKAEQPSLWEVR